MGSIMPLPSSRMPNRLRATPSSRQTTTTAREPVRGRDPVYFHGLPEEGRALKIASTRFPQFLGKDQYASVPQFTGKDVRAAEVSDSPFPTLLEPVDDLPPATVIRAVQRQGDKLTIRGVSVDDGQVVRVTVKGHPATIVDSNAGVADWEITLEKPVDGVIRAGATNSAGNLEKDPALVSCDF